MTNITQRNENILRRQVFPIPANVAPTGLRCIQLKIPDDDEHMAIFAGAIDLLCKWNSWQRDGTNNAALAASVWRAAIYDNPMFEICDSNPENAGYAGAGGGDEFMLRQNPTKPCLLETSVNGVDWCVWADLSKCLTPSGQPGEGTEPPAPGGGSQCYELRLQASGTRLLPLIVNAGDTINLETSGGAGTDGSIHWFCPDGSIFFAGFCGGGAAPDPSDPLPTANHMAIIAQIAGTYYDLTNGIITVGGGVVNEQVFIQVNDSTLGDNSGEYTLSVCVTNNQASEFTHVFKFDVTQGGFVFNSNSGWSPDQWGVWTPATGIVGTASFNAGAGTSHHGISMTKTFPHLILTGGTLEFMDTKGTFIAALTNGLYFLRSGVNAATATHAADTQPDGANTLVIAPGAYDTDQIGITIRDAYYTSGSDGTISTAKLTVTGLGTDPF
jgi:hypothetical protein